VRTADGLGRVAMPSFAPQQSDGVFAMIARGRDKLIEDGLSGFLGGLGIAFS
jgi:hypothetical protein